MGRKQKGGTTSPCRPLLCFRVCTHTPLDRVDLRQGGLHPHTQPGSGRAQVRAALQPALFAQATLLLPLWENGLFGLFMTHARPT